MNGSVSTAHAPWEALKKVAEAQNEYRSRNVTFAIARKLQREGWVAQGVHLGFPEGRAAVKAGLDRAINSAKLNIRLCAYRDNVRCNTYVNFSSAGMSYLSGSKRADS